MKLSSVTFLLLVICGRAGAMNSVPGDWIRINDPRTVVCFLDYVSAFQQAYQVQISNPQTRSEVLHPDIVFSQLVWQGHENKFAFKCEGAKQEAILNKTAIYINVATGEVLSEYGFTHHEESGQK